MGVAEEGLNGGDWGLSVGLTIKSHSASNDMLSKIKGYAGAATDVRMSGAPRAVMSSAGSGQPMASPPSFRSPWWPGTKKLSDRELAEAIALSHLGHRIRQGVHRAADPDLRVFGGRRGAGAAAGIVRVLGGDIDQAQHAVASLLSSLMGMICDGAKGFLRPEGLRRSGGGLRGGPHGHGQKRCTGHRGAGFPGHEIHMRPPLGDPLLQGVLRG